MFISRIRKPALWLTAAAVVSAATVFASAAQPSSTSQASSVHAAKAKLTDDQKAQIKAQLKDLRAALDRGELTAHDFALKADQVLGDQAFGKHHGRLAASMNALRQKWAHVAKKLGLTEDQQSAARGIFSGVRHDARVVVLETMASKRQMLTADQRAQFDQLKDEHFASLRQPAANGDQTQPHGTWHDRAQAFKGRLSERLNLLPGQEAAMKALHEKAREQFQSLRQDTRSKLSEILTPEQAKTLDQMREQHRERKQHQPETGAGTGA